MRSTISPASSPRPIADGNRQEAATGWTASPVPGSPREPGCACVQVDHILQGSGAWPRGYHDIQPNNKGQIEPLSRLKLTPGYAESHPSCGDIRFQITCPEDITHYKRLAKYNCHRPGCPICWRGWAARAADDAASRIEGYRIASDTPWAPRHVSFSPPPGTIATLEDLYDQANKLMRSAGIEAAMVIPHPYRLKRNTTDQIPVRSWGNRYTEALESATWRDRVVFSSHIHAIVYGPMPDSRTFFKLTGWVYRNHDDRHAGRLGDELRGTIYYLLSHAWVNGNNAVVRYWFGMNNHNLRKILGETYQETEPCPVCQTPCVTTQPDAVQADGTALPFYQNLKNAPIYRVRVKTWEYILASKLPGKIPICPRCDASKLLPNVTQVELWKKQTAT